jgi:hypothetical protein
LSQLTELKHQKLVTEKGKKKEKWKKNREDEKRLEGRKGGTDN